MYTRHIVQCTARRETSQADAQGCQGLSGVSVLWSCVWYHLYGMVRMVPYRV